MLIRLRLFRAGFITGLLLVAVTPDRIPAQIPGTHDDPQYGVNRVVTVPSTRGSCVQCHDTHAMESGAVTGVEPVLFRANENGLCFDTSGVGGCHNEPAVNYPLLDTEFMPEFSPYPGYPEANAGGDYTYGVEMRGRWPGSSVYENSGQYLGRDFSPHYIDSDMPQQDSQGAGMCLNCHSPHDTDNPFDQLTAMYTNIGGHADFGTPPNQQLCFDCHGPDGPAGMNGSGRLIADYFDESVNPGTAGHQIRRNSEIALSWPASVQVGDKLPCYLCHNPHGSRGASGASPNTFVLNDARPGWDGILDPTGSALDSRAVCFGCHIPSDGVPGSRVVMGIVMNTIPSKGAHKTSAAQNCAKTHGDLYDTPTSINIHNITTKSALSPEEFWK